MRSERASFEVFVLPSALAGGVVDDIRPRLMALVRETRGPIVELDASDVEVISSAGLGVLVATALSAKESGKRVEIRRASDLFCRSIALTGLAGHLGVQTQSLQPA